MTQALAQHVNATSVEIDRLAFAAYARWRNNHHDVYDALVHVFQTHSDSRLQELAGAAADEVLTTPMIRGAFEIEFRSRSEAERCAQG